MRAGKAIDYMSHDLPLSVFFCLCPCSVSAFFAPNSALPCLSLSLRSGAITIMLNFGRILLRYFEFKMQRCRFYHYLCSISVESCFVFELMV